MWLLPALFWLLVLAQFSRKQEAWGCCVCAVWGAGGRPLWWEEDVPPGPAMRSWVWSVEEPVHRG